MGIPQALSILRETITIEEALKDFKQKLSDLEQAEDELEMLFQKTLANN